MPACTKPITDGTLAYGASNAIFGGPVTVAGGTLDLGAFSDTVGVVTLSSGTITGAAGVLTGASYAVQDGTISAILGGGGGLTTCAATAEVSAERALPLAKPAFEAVTRTASVLATSPETTV